MTAPTVRLAMSDGQAERNGTLDRQDDGRGPLVAPGRPALLVSYVYLKPFLANRQRYHYRDWVLDSGAFSAHHSGTVIKLQDYIDCCKRLRDEDATLAEVFSLDVIGSWRESLKNCEEMWRQGVEAIPCYHVGEPEAVLKGLAADYPKIALGGCVGYRGKDDFAAQCFARTWPKRIHGFGFGSEKSIMALPWHSVDATNWEVGPCKFGRWNSFGKMSVRGSKQNLRAEVEWYLALEKRARQRWRKEMLQLAAAESPSVRLAVANTSEAAYSADKYPAALGPVVRLAAQQASDAQIARSGLAAPSVRLAYAETGKQGSPKIDRAFSDPGRKPSGPMSGDRPSASPLGEFPQ